MHKIQTALMSLLLLLSFLGILNMSLAGIMTVDKNGAETLISDGKLKHIDQEEVMILDSKTGELIYYKPNRMTFTRGRISDFCESMSKFMEQMMNSMPPEYRKMMGFDEVKKPPVVQIISEGAGGVIAGYKTKRYQVMADGTKHETVWIATDALLVKEFKQLVPLYSEFFKCSNMMKMGVPVEASTEYIKLMEKGLILKSIEYENGDKDVETNIVGLEIKEIPGSEFQVPTGYKQLSFTEFFSSQMDEE